VNLISLESINNEKLSIFLDRCSFIAIFVSCYLCSTAYLSVIKALLQIDASCKLLANTSSMNVH
jgi:hypothetical protein